MRLTAKIGCAAMLGVAAFAAHAQRPLTAHQGWALEYASMVGVSYYAEPLPADYRYQQTLEAVLITESSLCRHKRGIDHAAYGCGQLHRAAVREVNGAAVSPHKLRHNDALNIRLAARYLAYCMQQMQSWARGVVCYNKGPNRARAMSNAEIAADSYLKAVRRRIREAERLSNRLIADMSDTAGGAD